MFQSPSPFSTSFPSLVQGSSLNEGKFGSKRVEGIYREEQLKMLTHLNTNLDMLSLQGTGVNTVEKKKRRV